MVMVDGEDEDCYSLYDYCTGIGEHVDETIYRIDSMRMNRMTDYERKRHDILQNIHNTLTGKRLQEALGRHYERYGKYK